MKKLQLILFTLIFLSASLLTIAQDKPNILIIWGDDIGYSNISINSQGMMGYKTPNIDRIGHEGAVFTDWYAQQSCTAGRAAFILGQHPFRTGLLTIGMPGGEQGIKDNQPTIAELLKPLGYTSGQFGKNHLGDRDEHLPTNHGFDEFFGNLYHLNAEEEPENVGPWFYIQNQLHGLKIIPIARIASGSPATGLTRLHQIGQKEIINKVFKPCHCELKNKYCGLQCVEGKTREEILKQHKYFEEPQRFSI